MNTRLVGSVSVGTLLLALAASLAVAATYVYRERPSATFGLPAVDGPANVAPAGDVKTPATEREAGPAVPVIDSAPRVPALDASAGSGPLAPAGPAAPVTDRDSEAPYNAPPVQKNLPGDGRPIGDGDQSGGPRGGHKGGFDY